MFLCSMQCAKHEVDNVFVAGFIIQLCTDMAADIGHFNPCLLYTSDAADE